MYQSQFSCDSSGAVLQSQKVRYEPVGQKNKKQNKTTATTKTKNTKHLTRIRIFFKTEIFSLRFRAFRQHEIGVSGHQKGMFQKPFPGKEDILKPSASCLLVDRRKRRFSNENMSYIIYCQYHACSVTGMLSYFYHFSVFLWMGENNSFLCMAARNVHVRFSKISGYTWTGP